MARIRPSLGGRLAPRKLVRAVRGNEFRRSSSYWEQRYRSGGNSGAGSYGDLARYKAEFVNGFVAKNVVRRVVEFGCGDGAQLKMAKYPEYIGLDVAPGAIEQCSSHFSVDEQKSFFLYSPLHFRDPLGVLRGDLALSLDVVYHLVEDDVFEAYMRHLFQCARSHVIIYSSNDEDQVSAAAWIKHRRYTDWVANHCPDWRLVQEELNPYASSEVFAEFRVFSRSTA